jgi:membrane protein implicated in regulation of membrane protease activity
MPWSKFSLNPANPIIIIMMNAGWGNGGRMRPRILGMVFISISIAFLLASFYAESVVLLSYNVPLAGICLAFVVLAVVFFEHAERCDRKAQENVNTKVEKQIGGLTNVVASDVKRETMFNTELRSQIQSVSADMKTHDRELAADLSKQGKALAAGMKKQNKVNVEVKRSIKGISSDVKRLSKREGKVQTKAKKKARPARKKK